MFCEDPEELKMIEYLCSIYPEGDEHIIDLMVWCFRHRNSEFLRLLEKYKDFEGLEEQMVRFADIDMEHLKRENAPSYDPKVIADPNLMEATCDGVPIFNVTGSFCEGKDSDSVICDSCGS